MSTYVAKSTTGIVHAVYDQNEVYVHHRGNEDVAVCGLAEAWFAIDQGVIVTCLQCLAKMYTTTWWSANSDPVESGSLVRYLRSKR